MSLADRGIRSALGKRWIFIATFWGFFIVGWVQGANQPDSNGTGSPRGAFPASPNAFDPQTAFDPGLEKAGQKLSKDLSTSEWLGPLAPVALSPFFGLACLSGISCYGPDWLQQRSGLIQAQGPLHHPALFWTLAALTILTSLPRFSKVSKPVAMAAEKLETYSSIIILLLIRLLDSNSSEPAMAIEIPTVVAAGISWSTMPLDLFFGLAAALNIVVINAIKLFIELLVWLVPFPLVDASLEVFNKSLTASLMGLYCYSPMLATVINLALLSVCSMVFLKVVRRLRFYRDMIAGPFLAWALPGWFGSKPGELRGFLDQSWNGLPKLARVSAHETDVGWRISSRSLWKKVELHIEKVEPIKTSGILIQRAIFRHHSIPDLTIAHRRSLPSLRGE